MIKPRRPSALINLNKKPSNTLKDKRRKTTVSGKNNTAIDSSRIALREEKHQAAIKKSVTVANLDDATKPKLNLFSSPGDGEEGESDDKILDEELALNGDLLSNRKNKDK